MREGCLPLTTFYSSCLSRSLSSIDQFVWHCKLLQCYKSMENPQGNNKLVEGEISTTSCGDKKAPAMTPAALMLSGAWSLLQPGPVARDEKQRIVLDSALLSVGFELTHVAAGEVAGRLVVNEACCGSQRVYDPILLVCLRSGSGNASTSNYHRLIE